MAEKLSTFDKFHQEIDTELILEDVLHVDQEGVVHLEEDVLLHGDVVQLIVLKYEVFADALHGVESLRLLVLDEEHLTKSSFAYSFLNFKVRELSLDIPFLFENRLAFHFHGSPLLVKFGVSI